MSNAFLRNVGLSAIICLFLNVQMSHAAVKLGSYYGAWTTTATYAAGDVVTFSNKTYVSLVAANKNKNPSTVVTAWQVLGLGSTGPQGPRGLTGPAGPSGSGNSSLSGNHVGDMQYWNGSQWKIIAPPNPLPISPAVATLHFCNDKPTWSAICAPPINKNVYKVGDTGPAGGTVFYLSDNTGLHGLEAATQFRYWEQVTKWGCYNTSISGAYGTAIGTGANNTASILAGCSDTITAAKLADAYNVNGYGDWFLPSKDELHLFLSQNWWMGFTQIFWSSSEISNANAWGGAFSMPAYEAIVRVRLTLI